MYLIDQEVQRGHFEVSAGLNHLAVRYITTGCEIRTKIEGMDVS